jgi:hypothetical protein
MAHSITLGEVAQRIDMLDIRCSRCDRHGRLNITRLLAEHGPETPIAEVMRAQIGDCPKRDDAQIQNRCVRAIVRAPPGTMVTLGILRSGKEVKVPVTLAELPPNESYGTFLAEPGIAKPEVLAAALVNLGVYVQLRVRVEQVANVTRGARAPHGERITTTPAQEDKIAIRCHHS